MFRKNSLSDCGFVNRNYRGQVAGGKHFKVLKKTEQNTNNTWQPEVLYPIKKYPPGRKNRQPIRQKQRIYLSKLTLT